MDLSFTVIIIFFDVNFLLGKKDYKTYIDC